MRMCLFKINIYLNIETIRAEHYSALEFNKWAYIDATIVRNFLKLYFMIRRRENSLQHCRAPQQSSFPLQTDFMNSFCLIILFDNSFSKYELSRFFIVAGMHNFLVDHNMWELQHLRKLWNVWKIKTFFLQEYKISRCLCFEWVWLWLCSTIFST